MPGQATVTIKENQWTVWVASTTAELTTGLSGEESMAAGTGMLFVLPAKQQVTVDTTNMLFPIDIIFISESTVIDVARNIQPGYLVTEETPCDMFLEVNAGEADGVEVGDTVSTATIQEPGFDLSSIISFAIPLAALGFVCAMAGGMVKLIGGSPSSKQLSQGSAGSRWDKGTRFIGGCKVAGGLCHTHGSSVSKTVRCPKSPLTDEEWAAAWELVEAAFPKGMSNPWVNGWWPETMEEAEGAAKGYEWKMRDAIRMFRAKQRAAIENYERAADKATYNYRRYVVGEYERGKELSFVSSPGHHSMWLTPESPQKLAPAGRKGEYGTCYEDAWRFLIKEEEGELIHGSVQTIGKRINHAWVELPTGYIWEPESGEFMKKAYFYERAQPQVEARYTTEEAAIMAAHTKNFGPWTDEERGQILTREHHSMWLTLEERKELEKKYGMVAVRWAEEATKPGDLKAAERAAEYYYGKVKEALGLGHLSPELTEEQIMKLREVLGLPADVAEVLKIHQETGYIP